MGRIGVRVGETDSGEEREQGESERKGSERSEQGHGASHGAVRRNRERTARLPGERWSA